MDSNFSCAQLEDSQTWTEKHTSLSSLESVTFYLSIHKYRTYKKHNLVYLTHTDV